MARNKWLITRYFHCLIGFGIWWLVECFWWLLEHSGRTPPSLISLHCLSTLRREPMVSLTSRRILNLHLLGRIKSCYNWNSAWPPRTGYHLDLPFTFRLKSTDCSRRPTCPGSTLVQTCLKLKSKSLLMQEWSAEARCRSLGRWRMRRCWWFSYGL